MLTEDVRTGAASALGIATSGSAAVTIATAKRARQQVAHTYPSCHFGRLLIRQI